jgi:hypothetical protein
MAGQDAGKFSCTGCGRQYSWKPELAGRTAKCKCGVVRRVPEAAPRAEVSADDDAGLYELAAGAEVARPAAEAASAPVVRPPAAAVAAAGRGLAYENPKVRAKESLPEDKLTDPVRDLYVPVGMLVVGFLAVLGWGFREVSAGAEGIVVVGMAVGVTTLVKTVVVTGLALMFAPAMGISFGTLGSGVLKFAAILILADAALLWLDVVMQASGALPSSGHMGRGGRRGVWYVNVMTMVVIISVSSWYLFNMDSEETGTFAVPLAIVSWIVGFVLKLITIAVLTAMASAPAPAPVAAPAGGGGASAPAAPVTPAVELTERDVEIDQAIARSGSSLVEGGDWRRDNMKGRGRATAELIEKLYSQAGAGRVYVAGYGRELYVLLPEGAAARKACEAKAKALGQGAGFAVDPAGGATRKYVVLVGTGK